MMHSIHIMPMGIHNTYNKRTWQCNKIMIWILIVPTILGKKGGLRTPGIPKKCQAKRATGTYDITDITDITSIAACAFYTKWETSSGMHLVGDYFCCSKR